MSAKDPHELGPGARAAAGAIAGAIMCLGFFIVSRNLRGADEVVDPEGWPRFFRTIGAAAASCAIFGVALGAIRLRGRSERIVQGICLGAVVGAAGLGTIGILAGKAGVMAGVFLGAPLGTLLGGLVGVFYPKAFLMKRPPAMAEGVRDHELDG